MYSLDRLLKAREKEVQEAKVYRQHLDRNHAGVSRDGPVHYISAVSPGILLA